LGNINDDNFLEVFYSKKYQKLIENISKYKAKILYCNRCNEWNQKLDYKIINYVIKIKK
jgi:hypothetical protein